MNFVFKGYLIVSAPIFNGRTNIFLGFLVKCCLTCIHNCSSRMRRNHIWRMRAFQRH